MNGEQIQGERSKVKSEGARDDNVWRINTKCKVKGERSRSEGTILRANKYNGKVRD